MPEAVAAAAEHAERRDYVAELQELLTVSDAVVAECRPKLLETGQHVMATLVNPDHQQALEAYLSVCDWRYFGRPGDPLPKELAVYYEYGKYYIDLNSTIPYLQGSANTALPKLLEHAGIEHSLQSHYDELTARKPGIRSLLRDCVLTSDVYQFLASFDAPSLQQRHVPLTPYWRLIRETQIEQSLRIRHGYTDDTPIQTGSHIDTELRRAKHRLDDEQHPTVTFAQNEQTGVLRARTYLWPYLEEAFIANCEDSGLGRSKRLGKIGSTHGTYVLYDETGTDSVMLYEVAERVAETLLDTHFTGAPELHETMSMFLVYAIHDIFDLSLGSSLATILDDGAKEISQVMTEYLIDTRGIYPLRETSYDTYMLGHAPSHVPFETSRTHYDDYHDSWPGSVDTSAHLIAAREQRRQSRKAIGQVLAYGPHNYRVPLRILQNRVITRADHEMPPGTPEDLIIRMTSQQSYKQAPFIPGYTLSRLDRNTNTYGYAVNPEGDPYAPCEVRLSAEQQSQLTQSYRQIGLTALADAIHAQPGITVDDLTRAVQSHAVYHLPAETNQTFDRSDNPLEEPDTRISSLHSFAPLVRDDRLFVQCTGATQFLKHSLAEIFGEQSVATISGNAIAEHEVVISALGHMQTVFVHGNRQYILDATPAMPGRRDKEAHTPPATERKVSRHSPETPQLHYKARRREATHDESAQPKTIEERAGELLRSLVEISKITLNQANEQRLYRHIVTLPRDNIVRRTFQSLLRAKEGLVDTEALTATLEYLQACRTADHAMRVRLGFADYPQGYIDHLFYKLWDLEQIVSAQESRTTAK